MPNDIKERLIRLEHENKILRQNQGNQGDHASVQVIFKIVFDLLNFLYFEIFIFRSKLGIARRLRTKVRKAKKFEQRSESKDNAIRGLYRRN